MHAMAPAHTANAMALIHAMGWRLETSFERAYQRDVCSKPKPKQRRARIDLVREWIRTHYREITYESPYASIEALVRTSRTTREAMQTNTRWGVYAQWRRIASYYRRFDLSSRLDMPRQPHARAIERSLGLPEAGDWSHKKS